MKLGVIKQKWITAPELRVEAMLRKVAIVGAYLIFQLVELDISMERRNPRAMMLILQMYWLQFMPVEPGWGR